MNKALEQKLIGPMEESHTKEQSPQEVLWEVLWARRSKIAAKWARTRAWVGWWFFWEEEEVYGCRNKWRRATVGPRGRGACQGGRARPPPSWSGGCPPCFILSAKYSQIFQKNHTKLAGHLENFYFRGILILHGYSDNGREMLILFYLIQIT